MISIRLAALEDEYLRLAAAREPMGPAQMGPWLRGLGMARTQQLTGVNFADFVAADGKQKKARA